nr:MAG TPA: Transcriptional regulatory protein RcsB factor, DNA BINDING PROTEIN.6A [Caudoviricetes sp.]
MGKTKKSEKYDKIIELVLQDVPTSEIARITGYTIGYIHRIFEELRGEYGVNSKVGIATSYIAERINKTTDELNKLCSLMGRCKNTPCEKGRRGLRSAHKKDKKSKN